MTSEAAIDYDALHQIALRGLVRSVLAEVAKTGLPGDHHFYISYDVRSPGVALSKRLREKYPTEMTIVLQHRFWDLAVSEERFEVKLTFDGIPERLVVPFSAIKVFIDPSAKFVLQFDGDVAVDPEAPETEGRAPRRRQQRPVKGRTDRSVGTALQVASNASKGQDGAEGADLRPAPRQKPVAVPAGSTPAASRPARPQSEPSNDGEKAVPAAGSPGGGGQVVSLDAFRKK